CGITFLLSCDCIERQNSHMSKEKKNEEQRSAPLEPVLPFINLLQESQSAVELKKVKMAKLTPRVVIPLMEPSKKWRKFSYSPQWISILDVAQKIFDEEDRVKKKQKQNKRGGEEMLAGGNLEEGKAEIKREQLSDLCAPEGIQPNTGWDLQLLREQLPTPGPSYLQAEKEILTVNEIEDIIQEIVAVRAKERLSEESMPPEGRELFYQDASSINAQKPCYHRDRRMPH
ncbi:uncharacterized protein LOC118082791, partial [Zootoca vivipara]|uniref:uncharacterized protein LOC118082791 n=1 Tax=Zootoca vivipara TaxID=8524 RepID=UPI001592936F